MMENVKHLMDLQSEAEEKFLKEFRNGEYTPEHPLVILNPYSICPLTALVMFRTPEACTVSVRVKGKYRGTDISHVFAEEKEHILPVYGLYADYDNHVAIQLGSGECTELSIQTQPYHFHEAARALLCRCDEDYLDNELMFMMGQLNSKVAAYDRMGEIRWYTTEPFAFAMHRLKNGNMLIGSSRFMANPYMTTGVMELSMLGKIITEFCIPGGYHHDQIELPDGDLVILTQLPESSTKEDVAVRVSRKTGEIVQTWDLKDILPQDVGRSGHASDYDWFHNNSVAYDEKTDSLILSGRHQSAIINISMKDGKLNWILGTPEGWPEEMVKRYFFTPVGNTEEFEWPSEQHSAIVTDDGDIMCFDNGDFRSKDPSCYLKHRDSYSRGVKYRIDTEKMEIEQVWQYGKERGPEFYSGYIGNVEYYGKDHYLIQSGGIAYLNGEVSELLGSRLGRGAMKDFATLTAITAVVKDGRLVYECLVPANIYRSVKMKPYKDNEVFEEGKGKILGTLGKTKQAVCETTFDFSVAEKLPEEFCLHIGNECDRYDISCRFKEGDSVQFVIRNEEAVSCYSLITKVPPLTMKELPSEIDDGKKNFWKYINKDGLSGGRLYLCVNGVLYDTDDCL